MPGSRSCPDCRIALAGVPSGSVVALRCGRCRGIWLDPVSFGRVCDEEARSPDEETGIVPRRERAPPRARAADRVRYRACPECGDVMSQSNFGRVSGVVIDVCRPHGAWFDRGELGAIRRFLREGGLQRYERNRRAEAALESIPPSARPPPRDASLDDVYGVLVGGDSSRDVSSRFPRLLVAAFFGAAGAWLLWRAFHPRTYPRWHTAVAGIVCLYFAWRALRQWAARRRR